MNGFLPFSCLLEIEKSMVKTFSVFRRPLWPKFFRLFLCKCVLNDLAQKENPRMAFTLIIYL